MQKRAKRELGYELNEGPADLIIPGKAVHCNWVGRIRNETISLLKRRKVSEVIGQILISIKRVAGILILVSLICGPHRGATGEQGYSGSLSMRVEGVASIKRCPTESSLSSTVEPRLADRAQQKDGYRKFREISFTKTSVSQSSLRMLGIEFMKTV